MNPGADNKPDPGPVAQPESGEVHSWVLPSFDAEQDQIIATEEKRRQDQAAAELGEDELVEETEQTVEPLTVQQLEEIRLQAHKEGYQAGYDEGHHQGLSAGLSEGHEQGEREVRQRLEPELQANTQLLADLGAQLVQVYAEQQQQLQPLVEQMVLGLARQFVEREVSQGTEFLQQLIKQGIAALPSNGEDITIEVNPQQRHALAAELFIDELNWQLQENPELGLWDCRISTRISQVRLDFEQRWQTLLQQFEQGRLQAQNMPVDTPTPAEALPGDTPDNSEAVPPCN
ncbi:MAG: FliH/SctL family protein [Cellvibrionaceae bacterium]|nr:FliH/SctL family protein [Cellvibrionaceae bacterium]